MTHDDKNEIDRLDAYLKTEAAGGGVDECRAHPFSVSARQEDSFSISGTEDKALVDAAFREIFRDHGLPEDEEALFELPAQLVDVPDPLE